MSLSFFLFYLFRSLFIRQKLTNYQNASLDYRCFFVFFLGSGTKTINLVQDGGIGNLCVKCHQPRPMTTNTNKYDGNVFDYATLVSNPNAIFYDTTKIYPSPGKDSNIVALSYRSGNHYGAVGAIFAGQGGIEFAGSLSYSNSPHATKASCQNCHMADMTGAAGGHTFKAKGNFNGCNVTGCHIDDPLSSTYNGYWSDIRNEMKGLLTTLAGKINAFGYAGHPILHSDATETNLWLGITTGNYDGYLDIYSSSSNPSGYYGKAGNPKFPSLTNKQMGAILNFQLCLREYSLGIHNTKYTRALLTNTIEQLP